jgi:hypothetical protein
MYISTVTSEVESNLMTTRRGDIVLLLLPIRRGSQANEKSV